MAVESELTVRPASSHDHLGVMTVLDGAMLETDAETIERRIENGFVFVATERRRVLGALVAVPRANGVHIEAIAVRRRRRGQGIGTALVENVADRWDRLTAEFDPEVRPFYKSLGFEIEDLGERYRGVLERE